MFKHATIESNHQKIYFTSHLKKYNLCKGKSYYPVSHRENKKIKWQSLNLNDPYELYAVK